MGTPFPLIPPHKQDTGQNPWATALLGKGAPCLLCAEQGICAYPIAHPGLLKEYWERAGGRIMASAARGVWQLLKGALLLTPRLYLAIPPSL